ncbi:hypothetical protein J6590_102455 [Homalodisca vitripennis]|nr:hypothetical protein J6590_102455 [Homalodisca vitripennis]
MMLVNAHYLYNEVRTSSGENKMPLYDFRLEVIDKLLPDVPEPPRPLKRRRVPHVPSRITEKVACGKRSKQKRCRVCYVNGRKKYVMWQCLECDGQPGLLGVSEKYRRPRKRAPPKLGANQKKQSHATSGKRDKETRFRNIYLPKVGELASHVERDEQRTDSKRSSFSERVSEQSDRSEQ